MDPDTPAIVTLIGVIVLFIALCAALILVVISLRRPRGPVLIAAAAIVVLALVTLSILPAHLPVLAAAALAILGTALAIVGGNPFTRWVLSVADGGRTTEGPRGGILVEMMSGRDTDAVHEEEILRGGTTIGYLERACAALGILAGFPGAVAIVVALKGVGRFTELATPAARERFIVGTMASLLWACAVAGVVWLAVW
ncbi:MULTISPECIES: hypothetical protein [Microbacterium]|uniref:Uncharacterized protein n=1 Tax=Microbacterium laevaniformans TaxID=36807 RepID=A0A150HGS5_9MICO|nr:MULTISPECIES: hypothetical protein [Microbacterium]EXJ51977.1 hypothetical protein AS96_06495 [Microbacterium sp. MRS-1]KXZ61124.1 hypothetical protein Mlaev_00764 [Microbacterium laevaniformans]ODT24482.1 MAG: hypothetical protein ABS64_06230 [Microbacterium sp. SCN 69-37]RKS88338.1 hypothetical protein DEU37_1958 [Microbacterium sp. AG790]